MSDKYKVLSTLSAVIEGELVGFGEDEGTDREGNQLRTPCDVAEIITEDGVRYRVWIRTQSMADAFNEIVDSESDNVKLLRTTREIEVKEGKKTVVKPQTYHDFLKARASAPEKVAIPAERLER